MINQTQLAKQLRIDQQEGAIKLHQRGYSIAEIAAIYNRQQQTIKKYINNGDLKPVEGDKTEAMRFGIAYDLRAHSQSKYEEN
jgi:transposase